MTCSTDPYSHHQRYKFFGKGLGEASPFDTPLPAPSLPSEPPTDTPSSEPMVDRRGDPQWVVSSTYRRFSKRPTVGLPEGLQTLMASAFDDGSRLSL